jgi:hypothetical protein
MAPSPTKNAQVIHKGHERWKTLDLRKDISKKNLPHLWVSLHATTKYGLSALAPGMASMWKNLTHTLLIVDLACLLFDVHGLVSILVWMGSLFPFLEVDLFNLSNKSPLGCCWDDPPPCSYCPPYYRTHHAYCASSLERCIARCNSSSLAESMLWTTFHSVATSSLNNDCRCRALLFSAVLSRSRWK